MSDDKITITDSSMSGYTFDGFEAGDYITVGDGTKFTANGTYTITDTTGSYITIKDHYQEQIDDLNKKFDKIMDRLGVLDDPDPGKLEKHKALKRAYEKYKMLEKLCGANDD